MSDPLTHDYAHWCWCIECDALFGLDPSDDGDDGFSDRFSDYYEGE